MQHHERIGDKQFRKAVDLIDAGDVAALQQQLSTEPDLATRRVRLGSDDYFDEPSLLEFIAENPIRHGRISANITDIAGALIDAGADRQSINATLGLVASGRIVRESQLQKPLIALLCQRGANPDSALLAALGHGEFEAIEALVDAGANNSLAVAAATGNTNDAGKFIDDADDDDKHLALALAAQFGRDQIVKLLLNASVDPSRYNPNGAHAHTTPLHQSALGGHFDVVKLLVDAGADTQMPDRIHNATPRAWATHGGDARIINFLEQIEKNHSG